MSDLRKMINGDRRTDVEDTHMAALYALARKRYETWSSILSMLAVLVVFFVAAAAACLVALAIWVWNWAV